MHPVVAAVERGPLGTFSFNARPSGKPQYDPRRIERATYRDFGLRFVAAKTHPDHDTIAAFIQVLLIAPAQIPLQLTLAQPLPRHTETRGQKGQ